MEWKQWCRATCWWYWIYRRIIGNFSFLFFSFNSMGSAWTTPFFFAQYLLKVNNNKTTNELTRVCVLLHHLDSCCCCREKSRRFFLYFVALFIFIKNALKGTIFSENIEGKKINGNEWLLMMDHFSKRDLFGKCEKMIIFFRVNFIPFIYLFFSLVRLLCRLWTDAHHFLNFFERYIYIFLLKCIYTFHPATRAGLGYTPIIIINICVRSFNNHISLIIHDL